jgi:magnesium transporter
VRYRQVLIPKQDVVMHIVDQTYSAEEEDIEENGAKMLHVAYFRDVYDHTVADLARLEAHYEACTGSETTYLAKVSITVGNASNRMAHLMKQFSSIGTMLLPLSYIVGVFGMNVPVPYQQSGETGVYFDLTAFYWLLIGMMIFVIICSFWFKKNNWL